MTVRERLAQLGVEVEAGNCAGGLEMKYSLIGENRFEKFCSQGCCPDCLKLYLDLKF